jgi:predicted anti-sigma-YlaC factor YlaD
MDQVHRLNEGEVADALAGQPPEERIADCESCAEEFAAWAELGDKLRSDLESRADLPAYFWMRQQARIRERLAPRATQLRWAAAAIFALILLAFALIHQGVAPRTEIAQTTAPAAAAQVAQADPDDVLLEDIHASLQREVPAPLAPAAVLVQEMASASNQDQQTKEN